MELKVGRKFYYPSSHGIALICQILGVSKAFIEISISGHKFRVHKKSFKNYAIPLDTIKSEIYITQKLFDPDNKLIYLRHSYYDTWVDKLYNWYCRKKKRDKVHIID